MEQEIYEGPSPRITRYKLASFGAFTSAVFLLVVATYPSFFFFDLLNQTDGLRSVILILCTIAWVLIAFGPALIFGFFAAGYTKGIKLLPLVALAWPATLVLNHVYLAINDGNPYLTYLVNYPMFIATDILLPMLLVALWLEFRYESHHIYRQVLSSKNRR